MLLRPSYLQPSGIVAHFRPAVSGKPCFVIHPPTHELAEMLVVDSTALQDENYSGIYDAEGDYIPQYCDNPEDIPQGALTANPSEKPAPIPGAMGETDEPAANSSPDDDSSKVGS